MRFLGGFLVELLVWTMWMGAGYALAQVTPKKEPKVSLVRVVDPETRVVCYTLIGASLTGASGISCADLGTRISLPKSKLIPVD